MKKNVEVTCSTLCMQVMIEAIRVHIEVYFPEGSGGGSLEARHALLVVVASLQQAIAAGEETFQLNKRIRPFCGVALDNYFEQNDKPMAQCDLLKAALKGATVSEQAYLDASVPSG